MTSTDQVGVETTAPAPGRRAPRFAFPVIDRVVRAQESPAEPEPPHTDNQSIVPPT